MRKPDAHVKTIRTTRDGVGRVYGIVIGMAATPDQARAEVSRNAEVEAQLLEPRKPARGVVAAYIAFEESTPGAYEVVDVHFTAGVIDGGGSGWLAYGTLAKKETA